MHDDEKLTSSDSEQIAGAAASADPAVGLAAVRALRTLADRLEDVQVGNARSAGWSWQAIADVLQISRQAVHQKHAYRETEVAGSRGGGPTGTDSAPRAGKDGNDVQPTQ